MPPVTRAALAPELALPPPYQPVRLREVGDAFAHAITLAPERGAGTLVYVGRFDLAEFAVVLEPADPLVKSRRVFYAGMAALADAIAGAAPPETAIHIAWPDALYVNWGLVGGGRLAWPKEARETAVPQWMVFGAVVRTASPNTVDPGLDPDLTALDEEGFTDIATNTIIEGFARNLMLLINAWQESGFAPIGERYFERVSSNTAESRDIDENGDLLLTDIGGAKERTLLLPRLAKPSWLELAARWRP